MLSEDGAGVSEWRRMRVDRSVRRCCINDGSRGKEKLALHHGRNQGGLKAFVGNPNRKSRETLNAMLQRHWGLIEQLGARD